MTALFNTNGSHASAGAGDPDPGESRAGRGMLDRLGIGVSAFCLLQCLAVPLALVFAPLAGAGLLSHELFHLVVLAVIVPVGLAAFTLGYLKHRDARLWAPASLGFLLLLAAAILEQRHALGPGWIATVTSAGGLALIVAHVMNLRARRGGPGRAVR